MTGIYGKLPTYGDFVRRGLPPSFVQPWDDWLQAGVDAAREALGADFDALWTAAPPWRFYLPAGVCGPEAVVGVLLTSRDAVGRPFPLTLAAPVADDQPLPDDAWYAALEQAGRAGRDQGHTVDALLSMLPGTATVVRTASVLDLPRAGWWTHDGRRWALAALPAVSQFRSLLQDGAASLRIEAGAATHQGTVRSRNEDAYVDRSDIGLWAVADGAGGHGAGDVASAAAVAALADLPRGLSAAEVLAQVRLRIGAVHADLQRRAADSRGGIMATTIVVLMVRGDHFACLWAGDSRAYLWRDGVLSQITRDHSLVQELVEAGTLRPEDAEDHPHANVITRAVGSQDPLELDKVAGRVEPGDVLLLCSDGLFKALAEAEMAQLLAAGSGPQPLIDRALQAAARDNVTALTVSVRA